MAARQLRCPVALILLQAIMPVGVAQWARAEAPSRSPRSWFPVRSPAVSAVVAGLVAAGVVVPAEAATTYSAPLRTAVRALPVAAESNTG